MPFIVSVGDGRATSPSGETLDVLIQTRALSSSVWRQRIGREAENIHHLNIRTFCLYEKSMMRIEIKHKGKYLAKF